MTTDQSLKQLQLKEAKANELKELVRLAEKHGYSLVPSLGHPGTLLGQQVVPSVPTRPSMLSIVCPRCHRRSYNLNDVKEKYCGWCHMFHSEMGGELD